MTGTSPIRTYVCPLYLFRGAAQRSTHLWRGRRFLGHRQQGELAHYADQLAAVNYTHTFGSSLLMEGRIGFTRFALTGYQSDVGQLTNNQVGILGINTNEPLTQGLAGITVSGPVGGFTMGIPPARGFPAFEL